MTTTLSNGVKVPDVGSTNWASDLETNWTLLNACIGDIGSNVQLNRANTWTATQTFSEPIVGDLTGTATMAGSDASGNDIPTTYATKTELATKQDALTASQLNAVNSGITSALVTQIGTNQGDIATKANDDEVVHLAGAETIPGDKTHAGLLAITGNNLFAWERPQVTMGTLPSSTVYYGTTRYRDSAQATFCMQRGSVATTGTTTMNWYVYAWNDASIYRGFTLSISADGTAAQLKPLNNATTDLGTSSNKWKTLNGVNPGNLSIPDMYSVVDISGSITAFDGTPIDLSSIITVPGWVNIVIPYVAGDYIRFILGRTGGSTALRNSRYIICGGSDGDFISVFAPVSTGLAVQTYIKASGGTVTHARFYPCLGNV